MACLPIWYYKSIVITLEDVKHIKLEVTFIKGGIPKFSDSAKFGPVPGEILTNLSIFLYSENLNIKQN
jgi:hypothetical protein